MNTAFLVGDIVKFNPDRIEFLNVWAKDELERGAEYLVQSVGDKTVQVVGRDEFGRKNKYNLGMDNLVKVDKIKAIEL